jgi:predicted Zn-dependent peptidase
MNTEVLKRPVIKQAAPGKIPEARCVRLRNGIPVFLIESGSENIIRVEFIFNAGHLREGKPLVASTVNSMLTEGSDCHSSSYINNTLDWHGAFYHQYTERDMAGFIICFLERRMEKILNLSSEILLKPVFPEKELRIILKKRFQDYIINKEKVQNLALEKFFNCIFGDHPYGRMIQPQDFTNITPGILRDFHSGYYVSGNMAILVTGYISDRIIEILSSSFGDLPPAGEPQMMKKVLHSLPQKHFGIEKRNAVQTAVIIGSPTINKCHPDYPGLKILNTILGGYFGSRLMKNIREDKGYTYGISSSVTSLKMSGYKIISAEVNKKYSQATIDEIFKEIRMLQKKPVGKEELKIVKNYMLGEMIRMFDGMFALAESFRAVWDFGLDNSYYYRFAEKIKSISAEEIISLANTYYNIDDLYVITAG